MEVKKAEPVAPVETSTVTQVTAQPTEAGMVMWMDGESGFFKDKGAKECGVGDRIDRWQDKQQAAGANDLHYLFSKLRIRKETFPTLARINNKHGLKGSHKVALFDKDNNLALYTSEATEDYPALMSIGETFNGPAFAMAILFRSSKTTRSDLHSAGKDRQPSDWAMSTKDGFLLAEVGLPPRKVEIALPSKDGFNLVFMEHDNTVSRVQISVGNHDFTQFLKDEVSLGSPLSGPVQRVRLGRANAVDRKKDEDFEGEIAMLIVYNRALTDEDRKTLGTYVNQRYFGR